LRGVTEDDPPRLVAAWTKALGILVPEGVEELSSSLGCHFEARLVTSEVYRRLSHPRGRSFAAYLVDGERHGAALACGIRAVLVENPVEDAVVKEEEIPVGGKGAFERDHRPVRGTLEHATRGRLPVTLGDGSPCALAQVIHVRLELLLEPRVIDEEGGGGIIGRNAIAGIEDTRQRHRLARGIERAVIVVFGGANREDDGATLDVERLEASVDGDAVIVVARRFDPERSSRIK